MDKRITKLLLSSVIIGTVLSLQSVEACSGFIIGKGLTKDGSTLYGRTEDYPYKHGDGTVAKQHTHNKNFIVNPAKDYEEGAMFEDVSTGFTYPHLRHEFKYTSVSDDSRDTDEGIFDEHGFNEYGVSLTATLTTTPREDVLAVDPLVKDGIAEAGMTTLILPRVKTAREGVELLAKVIDEKGSAEGNNIMIADKNELWYMEIYSGHQYVAYKYPDDKFSIMPNTYFLGTVDLTDTNNVIASKGIIETAKKAGSYKEVNGKFHLAASYAPKLDERNRSRQYAGIKLLNPQSSVTYQDEYYEFLQDSPRRDYTVADAIKIQRNRFETLSEGFVPDDEVPGYDFYNDYTPKDNIKALPEAERAKYKYAPGNENVIDPHIYQIRNDLPSELGGVMWLGLSRSRNTPYVPYFGHIKDTFKAYQVRGGDYNPDSWYWVADHIDKMVTEHKDLFGKTIKSNWEELEQILFAYQDKLINEYRGKSNDYVRANADSYTKQSMKVAETVFKIMKDTEAKMEKAIETKTPLKGNFVDISSIKDVTLYRPNKDNTTNVENNHTESSSQGNQYSNSYTYTNTYTNSSTNVEEKKNDKVDTPKKSGWVQENNHWVMYRGDEKVTGWFNQDGTWYYLDQDGSMQKWWIKDKGEWYFLNGSGAMETGWLLDQGKWYYLESSGAMKASQWFEVDGKWYYVNDSGELLVNTTTPDGYTVNANGEWV